MKALISALIVLLIPTIALGEMQYIPKWHRQGDLATYSLDEAKQLVLLDARLVFLEGSYSKDQEIIQKLRESTEGIKEAQEKLKRALGITTEFNVELHQELNKCIQEKNDAAASSYDLGWIVAGGLLLFIAGGGVTYALTK